jgi:hypothetical protein
MAVDSEVLTPEAPERLTVPERQELGKSKWTQLPRGG